ncbi:prominin-2 [Eucyclogobius newberryi]|uniref:prominin-2 n=1 Tax=Eucyclogobius newberryi TaxID=166745 RepID=UPI003B59FD39
MGTSEMMRRYLWRRAMEFMVVMVLLVGSGLSQAVPSPSLCSRVMPQTLEHPKYEESTTPVGDFMAPFVQSFLQTVQSRSFPKDLVLEIVKNPDDVVTNQEFVKEVLLYEQGFLVGAAIGILYIVLMPIVGFFLACCRCNGKCGGKMHQKQTTSTHFRRRMLYFATFVTTVIILAGNVCMFRGNQAFKVSVENSTVELNKAFNNIKTFITAVPQQAQSVVNESYGSIQMVTNNLDAIGPNLGSEIQKQFKPTFTSALQSLGSLDKEVENTSGLLNKLNTSLTILESRMNTIDSDINTFKTKVDNTFAKPGCIDCNKLKPEIDKVIVSSLNTSIVSDMEKPLNEIINVDLSSKIKEAQGMFNDIQETVTNETSKVVQNIKTELEKIKSQISTVNTQLKLSALDGVLSQLKQVQGDVDNFSPEVKRAEYIRWCVCSVLCCVILLVVLCNICGLILGPLGLKPNLEPTKRSSMSNCGGTLFMTGAGLSFLISWLFMLLVLILFLIGGNAYTLLCKPWKDGELLKLIDTPGVIPGFNPNAAFGVNVNISGVYQDCNENKPAWSVFHLNQQINLDDMLNVSKYTDAIAKDFDNNNITLSPVTFLTPDMKKDLQSFKAKSFDFKTPVQKINDISNIDFNPTIAKLDQLATVALVDSKQELKNEAQSLRNIQTDIETTIFPELATVNSTIDELETAVGGINAIVGEVLSSLDAAQDFFDKNAADIVKTESRVFLDCQLGIFSAFAGWAKKMITQEIGRCGPVAGAVNSAEIIVCSNMVESLNAFWFSLGWCMIFLIPSLILSIKLAKFYRRMKYADVFDERIQLNYIPRAQMNFH